MMSTKLLQRIANKLLNLRVVDRRNLYMERERRHLKILLSYLEVDCVFDIGANAGQYAKMLRRHAKYDGRIISFEPNPVFAERVRLAARGDNRWQVEEVAVSNQDGEATFNVMRDSQFSSLSTPDHSRTREYEQSNAIVSQVEVKTETLTTAYERLQHKYSFTKPFLKMDTQGYDVEIVRNAGPALAKFVGLQSELSITPLYAHSVDFRAALECYEQSGFELSAFVPNNAGSFPLLNEIDCIMVRRK